MILFWMIHSFLSFQTSSSEKALANQFLAPGRTPTTTKERTPATKTVHLQTKARYTGEMRRELLGTVCPLGQLCHHAPLSILGVVGVGSSAVVLFYQVGSHSFHICIWILLGWLFKVTERYLYIFCFSELFILFFRPTYLALAKVDYSVTVLCCID